MPRKNSDRFWRLYRHSTFLFLCASYKRMTESDERHCKNMAAYIQEQMMLKLMKKPPEWGRLANGPAMKNTCKVIGIEHSEKAVLAFLNAN